MKKTLRNITIAYYSVYFGAIASAFLGFKILESGIHVDPLSDTGTALSSATILLLIVTVPLALALFNKMTKKWSEIENTSLKFHKYQTGAIIRIIVIGINIFAGVLLFYVMQSKSMIFCAGIAAVALFFCKPAEVKIITELKLEEEIEE